MSIHYAAIVIGSGQGGGPVAQAYAKAGHKTALIEATHIGGTCINEGCTPTKTMVASAKVANTVVRGPTYGVQYKRSSLVLGMETVRQRKRDIVESFRQGSEKRIQAAKNLDLIRGTARFTGPKEIEVSMNVSEEVKSYTADKFFINAGCSPAKPNYKGLDSAKLLTSTSIMELEEVPKHLVVIGGGYIGVEFAQMFRRFGARVTIIQRASRLLPREDEDVSKAVHDILTEAGIDILLDAKLENIYPVRTGQLALEIPNSSHGVSKTILTHHILSAAGRTPNTASLNLSSAGVEVDSHGYIKVNHHLETTTPNIYALGDIKGGPQFTHISYDDSRILIANLLNHPTPSPLLSTDDRFVPYTVFMDPQLGRVGHTESSAVTAYGRDKIKIAKMPMSYVARALEMDETEGFMKAVVDAETKKILGFACLGVEGGEVMSMVQIAMMAGMTYDRLENATFAHPCLSESLNNLWGFLE